LECLIIWDGVSNKLSLSRIPKNIPRPTLVPCSASSPNSQSESLRLTRSHQAHAFELRPRPDQRQRHGVVKNSPSPGSKLFSIKKRSNPIRESARRRAWGPPIVPLDGGMVPTPMPRATPTSIFGESPCHVPTAPHHEQSNLRMFLISLLAANLGRGREGASHGAGLYTLCSCVSVSPRSAWRLEV
jgi:hypothetical protein